MLCAGEQRSINYWDQGRPGARTGAATADGSEGLNRGGRLEEHGSEGADSGSLERSAACVTRARLTARAKQK